MATQSAVHIDVLRVRKELRAIQTYDLVAFSGTLNFKRYFAPFLLHFRVVSITMTVRIRLDTLRRPCRLYCYRLSSTKRSSAIDSWLVMLKTSSTSALATRTLHKIEDSYRIGAGRLKDHLGAVSWTFNHLSGYNQIEELKQKVRVVDVKLGELKRACSKAKDDYEVAIVGRSKLQKEMNNLLQRKNSWTEADVTAFTQLYRDEHRLETQELDLKEQYRVASDLVEEEQAILMECIRERYSTEQLWSDKVRSLSTYWTWALMGLHLGLFVVIQVFVEPRKRREIVQGVLSGLPIPSLLEQNLVAVQADLEQLKTTQGYVAQLPLQTAIPADGNVPQYCIADDMREKGRQERINNTLLVGIQSFVAGAALTFLAVCLRS